MCWLCREKAEIQPCFSPLSLIRKYNHVIVWAHIISLSHSSHSQFIIIIITHKAKLNSYSRKIKINSKYLELKTWFSYALRTKWHQRMRMEQNVHVFPQWSDILTGRRSHYLTKGARCHLEQWRLWAPTRPARGHSC